MHNLYEIVLAARLGEASVVPITLRAKTVPDAISEALTLGRQIDPNLTGDAIAVASIVGT